MNVRRIASAFALALALCAASAQADVTITIDEVGPDVVASESGTINLTGLTFFGSGTLITPVVEPSSAVVTMGLPNTGSDLYQGLTGPSSFGPGGPISASSGSGTPFGVQGDGGFLVVPSGYVSGHGLSSTATFDNTTISGLGLTPGTYTFDLPQDTITVQISPTTAVPEPSTTLAVAVGMLAGLGVWARRRRATRPK